MTKIYIVPQTIPNPFFPFYSFYFEYLLVSEVNEEFILYLDVKQCKGCDAYLFLAIKLSQTPHHSMK